MTVYGDKPKYQLVQEIWEDKPLLKRQWENHEVLGTDGQGNSMEFAKNIKAYKCIMDMADQKIVAYVQAEIEQARTSGAHFALVEFYAMKRLVEIWNAADLRIEITADVKKRHKMLAKRHNHRFAIEDYVPRDQAFEMDALDWERFARAAGKPSDTIIQNDYDEKYYEEARQIAKWLIVVFA